jgi:hypothetical protein
MHVLVVFESRLRQFLLCFMSTRFSCCDLDGDGTLTAAEMRHFYKQQILRVTNIVSDSILSCDDDDNDDK